MFYLRYCIFTLMGLLALSAGFASVELASVFQSNMVLQRGLPAPVWGQAEPGQRVTVRFGGQVKTTQAGPDGAWRVQLDPMEANATGTALAVDAARTCENVLVGDVWLVSGQSNMGFGLGQSDGGKEAAARADDYDWLRILKTPKKRADAPITDVEMDWKVCNRQTITWFSAVGFYFAEKVYSQVGVPIGLIDSSWAGAAIEPFITPEALRAVPELQAQADKKEVGTIYNARVYPTQPLAIRGVLWYQGETNGTDTQYALKLKALVDSWRASWGIDFSFYYVQISAWPSERRQYNPVVGAAVVREQQLKALSMIPRSGMAVSFDVGHDLHPGNKRDMGLRLARWALHRDFGLESVVVSGPLYQSSTVEADRIRIVFEYVHPGLTTGRQVSEQPFEETKGEPLRGFEIAGADQVWYPAIATISGADVWVASPQVPSPVAVRYAFSQYPSEANLYNQAGLPASPFRTEQWPLEMVK